MISNLHINNKLQDLLFEIQGGPEAKFLICVCDDRIVRRDVRRKLADQLTFAGKTVVSIAAQKARGKVLNAFLESRKNQNIDCINLWGLPSMKKIAADEIFLELNFHRDALAALSLPVLVWVNSSQLQRMPSVAPDFWSRRTAVYPFNQPNTKEFLAKLFAKFRKQAPGPVTSNISSAFEKLLNSEKALGSCLKRKESFSVEDIDEQMKNLDSTLDYILHECRSGHQLEIALWLWNATGIETDLQRFEKSLEPGIRDVFGYVYSDRTELILDLADKMPHILREYADIVREKVKRGKRANLVKLFTEIASKKIGETLEQLALTESKSVHRLPHHWTNDNLDYFDHYSDSIFEQSRQPNAFLYDLEGWLSGYASRQPEFFSADEAKLLKILYSQSSDPRHVAEQIGLSIRETQNRVADLEKRVRIYLSAGAEDLSGVAKVDIRITRAIPEKRIKGLPYSMIIKLKSLPYAMPIKKSRLSTTPSITLTFSRWAKLEQILKKTFHVNDYDLRLLRKHVMKRNSGLIENIYVTRAALIGANLIPLESGTVPNN